MEKRPPYNADTLRYAENVILRYPALVKRYDEECNALAYRHSVRSTQSSVNAQNSEHTEASNPTMYAALNHVSNRRFQQLMLSVVAVKEVYRILNDEEREFVKSYFWKGNRDTSLRSKRLRRKILALVCFRMGLPEEI